MLVSFETVFHLAAGTKVVAIHWDSPEKRPAVLWGISTVGIHGAHSDGRNGTASWNTLASRTDAAAYLAELLGVNRHDKSLLVVLDRICRAVKEGEHAPAPLAPESALRGSVLEALGSTSAGTSTLPSPPQPPPAPPVQSEKGKEEKPGCAAWLVLIFIIFAIGYGADKLGCGSCIHIASTEADVLEGTYPAPYPYSTGGGGTSALTTPPASRGDGGLRFGLSEERRKQAYRDVMLADVKAQYEAEVRGRGLSQGEQDDMFDELTSYAENAVAKAYGLTLDQLTLIAAEGAEKGWHYLEP